MTLLNPLLIALLILVLVPSSILAVQVVAAFMAGGSATYSKNEYPNRPRPALAVLIPAHNEAIVIEGTIRNLLPQLTSNDRLLVVADNCSDDTAAMAHRCGAEVVERFDPENKGKGFALNFGVAMLRDNPPEVLVIVDADCTVLPGALTMLAGDAVQFKRPIQGLNLMRGNSGNLKTSLAEFAWTLKNHTRPLGLARLNLPCQLMGTGMAFPWPQLSEIDLASGELVEDVQLGLNLALAGYPPKFQPAALVTSTFPDNAAAIRSQRTRWEHGHLGMIQSTLPRVILIALRRRDIQLLAMTLDLAIPPLALLVLTATTLFALSLIPAATGYSLLPVLLASAILIILGNTVFLAWVGWGKAIISLPRLCLAPLYALGKIPLYVRYWTRRQKTWVRTGRDQ